MIVRLRNLRAIGRGSLPFWLAVVGLLAPFGLSAADPFTLDEILAVLRAGSPAQPALVRMVSTRHVAFRLTPEVRRRLVAAGANRPLMRAIEFNPELSGTAIAPESPAETPPVVAPPEDAAAPVEVPTFQGDVVEELPSGPVTPLEIGAALNKHEDQVLLAATIADRGVSFKYTPDLGRAWLGEGATAELLAAVATAKVTLPPVPDGFEPVPLARAADYNEDSAKGRLDLRLHVDDIVEVRLQGDRIVWKTLKGGDGKDAGSEATQPFPMGPLRSLNVTKRDGRGQFVVLQKPEAENNFEMMLRIYDPKGGSDRYHLRIDWEHFE